MAMPIDAWKAGLANYFKSEEHSDCTIICGPYHFKVHKLVIGVHSDYFRTAKKADTFQEGKTGTIELKAIDPDSDEPEDACDDPEVVKLMVGYFYHLDYLHEDIVAAPPAAIEVSDSPAPPPKKKARKTAPAKRTRASTTASTEAAPPSGAEVHLIEHAKVFAMAVKYHIAGLQNLAVQKFEAEVAEHWDHEDLAHAIHVIYTSTADDVTQLREVAVEALDAHSGQLLEKPEIATLLRSITGLACDLLMRNRGSSTRHDFSKNTDVQEDVVCHAKYKHSLHRSVRGEVCSTSLPSILTAKSSEEGETGVIKLEAVHDGANDSDPCDDPEIVKLMVEYFYLLDYGAQLSDGTLHQIQSSSPPTLNSHLVEHAKAFAMAVKYQAEGLREHAAAKFAAAATTHWYHDDFPAAISVVYNSTTDDVLELRKTVEDVLHARFDDLKDTEELGAVVRVASRDLLTACWSVVLR